MRRIVPNISSNDLEKSKQFYSQFMGMELAMDLGWVLTFTSKENASAQITIVENKDDNPLDNSAIFLSIEVTDIDKWHLRAQEQNIPISYPLTNEEWGVRRFFVLDPNGATINLLEHL